jgi:hypothetical protein
MNFSGCVFSCFHASVTCFSCFHLANLLSDASTGNVFMAGTTNSDNFLGLSPLGTQDYFLVKYSSMGTLLTQSRYGSPGITSSARALSIASNGYLYMCGTLLMSCVRASGYRLVGLYVMHAYVNALNDSLV